MGRETVKDERIVTRFVLALGISQDDGGQTYGCEQEISETNRKKPKHENPSSGIGMHSAGGVVRISHRHFSDASTNNAK